MVEIWVNESLSYLEFSIKIKTPSYRVTIPKWVSITGNWPKPRDRTIVCRYTIRDESKQSNRNCKFVANDVFRWLHLRTQKGCVTNTYLAVNKIWLHDHTMVLLEELRSVYDRVIVLGYYWRKWKQCMIVWCTRKVLQVLIPIYNLVFVLW